MAGTTPKRGLPYPSNADAPNIAGDIQALATAVDTQLGSAGKAVIPGVQTRVNAAYGLLATPDCVQNLVVPADAVLKVRYRALWKVTGGGTAEATIFVGANQVKTLVVSGAPIVITQSLGTASVGYSPLYTHNILGLATDVSTTGDSTLVTTGFIMSGGAGQGDHDLTIDGLPAGTYEVSVQFKTNGTGTVSVKDRVLRARVQPL